MSAKAISAALPTRVGDLAGLDGLEHEAVALFVPSDVRPLRGVAGFVDWRTNGALSRALLSGSFSGDLGEILLAPTRGRLGPRRFFLFGLGPKNGVTRDALRELCERALSVCERAGVGKIALAAPEGLEDRFLNAAAEVGNGRVDVVLLSPKSDPA